MHAHVQTQVLRIASVKAAGSRLRKVISLMTMFLQSMMRAGVGLLEADYLLGAGCVQTLVQHLSVSVAG